MNPQQNAPNDMQLLMRVMSDRRADANDPPYSPARIILAELINAFFLVVWVLLQWGLHAFLAQFPLEGLEGMMVSIFKYLFAFATLVPIVVFIYVDTRIIFIRAAHTIKLEKGRWSK